MMLFDVNIFIYAFRSEMQRHEQFRSWIERAMNGDEPVGISELVFSSFIRITTNPKAFKYPSPMEEAVRVADHFLKHESSVVLRPSVSHWDLFTKLCATPAVRGNLVTDAYLAALAMEHDCEWITTDSDFARFPGLRWRHPLR